MNQTDFASVASITRKTLFGYESGTRAPDGGALAAWAAIGLDVAYVVTGVRTTASAAPSAPDLKPEHVALIDNYEACQPDDRAAIRRLASTAAQRVDVSVARRR